MHFFHIKGKQPESPNSTSDYDVKRKGIHEEDSDDEDLVPKYYYSRTADQVSNDEKRKIISLTSIPRTILCLLLSCKRAMFALRITHW